MSTKKVKEEWQKIPEKQKEKLWQEYYGTGIIPEKPSKNDINNLLKNTSHEKSNTGGGNLPL